MSNAKDTPAEQERPLNARVIAGARGWKGPAAGRAGHVETGSIYLGTTNQVAGLYPWMQAAGLPAEGVPIGPDLLTGEMECIDPAGWVGRLTSNPGVWIQGQPGVGKSAIAKRIATWLVGYGYQLLCPGDVKGEYSELVRRMGGQVVRVGRGMDRINPLDSGPLGRKLHTLPHAEAERLRAEINGRRGEFLHALLATTHGLGHRPVAAESTALSSAIRLADQLSRDRDPVIPDVISVLRAPTGELFDRLMVSDEAEYISLTRQLVAALENLCDGPLAGLFDSATTTPLDLDSPAVSVDLQPLLGAGDAVVAAGLLATWSYSYAAVDTARALGRASRPVVLPLDELWRALRAGPGMVDALDGITRLNRSKGEVSMMVTHSLRDLDALPTEEDRAKASGLMERCDTLVLAAMPRSELERVDAQRPLTDGEKDIVASWSSPATTGADGSTMVHPGRGKYLLKIGARVGVPVQLMLTPAELDLYDTDAAIRAHRESPSTEVVA
ncbi:ATP-binding protein [Nocardiopsis halophila]|uniref:ATP-binding protein n=1 Tax=Nocardiopsis halophila TaxID=141692 RepID=UPI00034C1B2E|nr:ATP-binding protein [Nocardiopsis halophila]